MNDTAGQVYGREGKAFAANPDDVDFILGTQEVEKEN